MAESELANLFVQLSTRGYESVEKQLRTTQYDLGQIGKNLDSGVFTKMSMAMAETAEQASMIQKRANFEQVNAELQTLLATAQHPMYQSMLKETQELDVETKRLTNEIKTLKQQADVEKLREQTKSPLFQQWIKETVEFEKASKKLNEEAAKLQQTLDFQKRVAEVGRFRASIEAATAAAVRLGESISRIYGMGVIGRISTAVGQQIGNAFSAATGMIHNAFNAVNQFGHSITALARPFHRLGLIMGAPFAFIMHHVHATTEEGKNLSDAYNKLGEEIGNTIAPHLRFLVELLQKATEWFKNLSPAMKATIGNWLAMGASIGATVFLFGTLASALGSIITLAGTFGGALVSALGILASPIGVIAAGLGSAIYLIGQLSGWWEILGNKASEVAGYINSSNESWITKLLKGIEIVVTALVQGVQKVKGIWHTAIDSIATAMAQIAEKAGWVPKGTEAQVLEESGRAAEARRRENEKTIASIHGIFSEVDKNLNHLWTQASPGQGLNLADKEKIKFESLDQEWKRIQEELNKEGADIAKESLEEQKKQTELLGAAVLALGGFKIPAPVQ